jgi:hypothetical protein
MPKATAVTPTGTRLALTMLSMKVVTVKLARASGALLPHATRAAVTGTAGATGLPLARGAVQRKSYCPP